MAILESLKRIPRKEDKKSHFELVPTKTEDSDRIICLLQIVLENGSGIGPVSSKERKLAGRAWSGEGMVFTTRKGHR